jgi:peptidoglycan-N-acetylglucosamine deacetylase
MHSDSEKIETKKAIPLIIEALQEQNYEIVDLETLLNVKAYK